MIKLYLPQGKAVIMEKDGQKKTAVLISGQLISGLPYTEMALYSAMQWHISDQDNLEEYYYRQAIKNSAFAELPLESCLESMQAKGLFTQVEGEEELSTMYQLFYQRKPKFCPKTWIERVCDYRMLRQRTVPVAMALDAIKKPRLSLWEKRTLFNIKNIPGRSVYELILTLKDRPMTPYFKQEPEALFYLQLLDEDQAYLKAIVRLFLTKHIIFE